MDMREMLESKWKKLYEMREELVSVKRNNVEQANIVLRQFQGSADQKGSDVLLGKYNQLIEQNGQLQNSIMALENAMRYIGDTMKLIKE